MNMEKSKSSVQEENDLTPGSKTKILADIERLKHQHLILLEQVNNHSAFNKLMVSKEGLSSFIMGELLKYHKDKMPTLVEGSFEPNSEDYLMLTSDTVFHDNKIYNVVKSTIIKT